MACVGKLGWDGEAVGRDASTMIHSRDCFPQTEHRRMKFVSALIFLGTDSRHGIYQFQDDLLVIGLGTTAGFRPTEFPKGDQQNHILLVRPTP